MSRIPPRYLLLALGVFWALLIYLGLDFKLNHFQERDILRAEALLGGHWDFWGPETNSGARLPGPFYSMLLALPIAVFGSWHSITFFLAVLSGASIACMSLLVYRSFGLLAALLVSIGLALHPDLTRELNKNWNPSFGIPVCIFIVATILRTQQPRAGSWLLAGLAIGCGVQVHGSFFAFVPAAAWVLFCGREGARGARGKLFGFLFGLLAPLLPALSTMSAEALWSRAPENADTFTLAAYLSRLFFHLPDNSLLSRVTITLGPVLHLALPGLMANRPEGSAERENLIRTMTVLSLATAPMAFLYLWGGYGSRYAISFIVCIVIRAALTAPPIGALREGRLFLTCIAITLLLVISFESQNFGWPLRAMEICARAILVIVCLQSLVRSGILRLSFSRRAFFTLMAALALVLMPAAISNRLGKSAQRPSLRQVEELTRLIYAKTGWAYPYFRWHTVALGISNETGFQLAYRDAVKNQDRPPESDFSGTILMGNRGTLGRSELLEQARKTNPKLIESIDVSAQDAFCTQDRKLCAFPYRAGPATPLMRHNLGVTYLKEEMPYQAELAELRSKGAEVKQVKPGLIIFSWNDCNTLAYDCRTLMVVELLPSEKYAELKVTIGGNSLSWPDRDLAPNWVQTWEKPFVSLECGGHSETFELVSQIGWISKYSVDGVLAPFQRVVASKCDWKNLTAIRAGKQASTAYRFRNDRGQVLTSEPLVWQM